MILEKISLMHACLHDDGQELCYIARVTASTFLVWNQAWLTSQKADLCLNRSKERHQIFCGNKALKKS